MQHLAFADHAARQWEPKREPSETMINKAATKHHALAHSGRRLRQPAQVNALLADFADNWGMRDADY
jgi:hypothetical protein